MTFPDGLTTIEVTGLSLLDFGGVPLSGTVIFTASEPVAAPGAEALLFGSATTEVVDGVLMPVTIPTTDCVSPPFTYTIEMKLDEPDASPSPWAGVSIPSALGASVDLSALL